MLTTSLGLLEQLRQSERSAAWARFVDLYTPLLHAWALRLSGMKETEAADLVQDVFLVLVQRLPQFQYNPLQSFRGWLRTILTNRWTDRQRGRPNPVSLSREALGDISCPDPREEQDEQEYRQYLVGRALCLMKSDFEPTTWKACWEVVCQGREPAAVAQELGMSVHAVYIAKARVLRRLRQELEGLLD
jgi:RNA polymerase sigma-70 factor (ECF subfamily)